MFFASDNTGPVHPKVMEALAAANTGYASPYGNDDLTAEAVTKVREVFEAPDAMVHFVPTGTAANALLLATLAKPWDAILCSDVAHVHVDECNAPEFFAGGAKLVLVPSSGGKITATDLHERIRSVAQGDVHCPQRGPVSITQVTERGGVYTLDEIGAICDVAKSHNMPVHLDGARFANAVAALGCTPAEMSWKAGVDAVSFGGTKNGLMAVEAAILFDPDKSFEFELRRKRAAHLFSKLRYLSAQMLAYLTDDLWLEMASEANRTGQKLAKALPDAGARLADPADASLMYVEWDRQAEERLRETDAQFSSSEIEHDRFLARLVTNWATTDDDVESFITALKG
ncbi:MAG: aminotransferase class V-fold PLP-dependent enzyme [Dinoroseobacter sp.]|nr:aminotransferase class V-fold PLP-dependent enzyme [Dinoroseobacter sp.]